MRAARLTAPGTIVIDDVPEPVPGPNDVLVAVGGVGLCGSDLSVFRGSWGVPSLPWILGHEAFGRVEAVGDRVAATRIGELVVIEPNFPCLRCASCAAGHTSGCVDRASLGMNRPGALADKVVVPGRFAWHAEGLTARDLVCIEPLTVVEAAIRRQGVPLPERVLVVGAGAQGLLMSVALVRRGVEVTALDLDPERVATAVTLGARPFPDGDHDPRFELVVDAAGSPASMDTALGRVASGGTVLVLGIDTRPFGISTSVLVRRRLTLRGSLTYDHPVDFQAVLSQVHGGVVAPGRVVTEEVPLAAAQQAFERSGSTAGKTWIRVDPTMP